MRLRTISVLSTLVLLSFVVSLWATPLSALQTTETGLPETQSASGKIASIGDAEFTLTMGRDQNRKEIHFLLDGNTKVDGQLAVGAQATVDFKLDSGKNIAIHVIVTPTSGMRSN